MDEDLELLERWRGGDRKAGNALFRRHFDVVARFFRNKVREGEADLIQKTFLNVLKAEANFRGEGTFRGFLIGVASNVLRHHYRSKGRHEDRIDFGTVSVYDLAPGLGTMLGRRRDETLLIEALRRLPLDHQIVLELYFWEDMTAGEIGQAIGAPEEHVASGDITPLLGWLREHVHPIGRALNAEELVQQISGRPLDSAPFLKYLDAKLEALTDLKGVSPCAP